MGGTIKSDLQNPVIMPILVGRTDTYSIQWKSQAHGTDKDVNKHFFFILFFPL